MIYLNNIIYLRAIVILLVATSIASCNNDYETVFSEPADVRVQRALDDQEAQLTSAPNGWRAILKTGSGIRYYYYFDFNNDGLVQMVSDFNVSTVEPMNGTWKLKALQRITLSFDTYSYIHLPADPDGDVNGGGNGEGRISDTEFAFAGISGDTILLAGTQRGSSIALLQATPQEADLALGGKMKKMIQYMANSEGLYFNIGPDNLVSLSFDLFNKVAVAQFISNDGKHVDIIRSPYLISSEGLELDLSFQTGGITINKFTWNEANENFNLNAGGESYTLQPISGLLIFNPEIPLHSVIGDRFLAIRVPANAGTNPLPGQSQSFRDLYTATAESLISGQYTLTLSDIYFIFDRDEKIMYVSVIVTRGNNAFVCNYYFDYTLNATGIFDFTYGGEDANGEAILNDMNNIFSYLESDQFTLKYIGGGNGLTGGFLSEQSPDFSFSGYLTSDI